MLSLQLSIASPYIPVGSKVTDGNINALVKWLVFHSWHTDEHNPEHDNVNYEFYEWDFEKHCLKNK